MKKITILGAALAACLASSPALAGGGPDINVLKIASNGSDYPYYGEVNGIAAYSMATTSCNPGDVPVEWTDTDHPVIGQNIFRLRDGYFEQLGQSWLKHGFCAVNEGGCGSCQSTNCDTLGIGCADTYWGTLNDGQGGGPKWQINALNGHHDHPYPSPTGLSTIRGRLQVKVSDIDPTLPENQGAVWFAEAQYVSEHDATNGNSANNNSWQKLAFTSHTNLNTGGPTQIGEPAVFAWRSEDPQVQVRQVINVDEGGPGVHGYMWVAARAYDMGDTYRYVYVVQNLTSKQSIARFSVPASDDLTIGNYYFNDVDYHSGEPYDGTDWSVTRSNDMVTFECTETYAQNPNANAIRWGTAYTFAFDANAAPQTGDGSELALFEPGTGDELPVTTTIPGGDPEAGVAYCFGDGSGTFCPCLNFGMTGRGCANGLYAAGCQLSATGVASVSSDSIVLRTTFAMPSQSGVFFQGDEVANGGAGAKFGDGLRCAGVNRVFLQAVTAAGGGVAQSSVSVGQIGGVQAGDTKRYQFWYRDPNSSPCGSGFNLSNGLELTWQP